MESCNCIEPQWPADELLMKYQYISDFFIALAYFSIPLELIYFVKKSSVFPYRWVLVQFGAFIVLCGATHLINLWTFNMHSRTVAIVMTTAKVLTAVVSCATALMLVHIIPDLLSVKTRELFLKNKAAELDREMGLIRTQEETGRHVRMLTHEIRSTLDRHTILKTTLVELGRTLALEECALWMPTRTGLELQLSYTLRQQNPVGYTVPIQLPVINQVFSSNRAVKISPNSPVARLRPLAGKYMPGEVVAVRVPLLHLSNFQINDWPELSTKRYALMVLMLPSDSARQWHVHELELVEVVADQVAVALSHAAILEESMRARDLLMQQNIALDSARREAETAIRARNDFLAVMNHEMRTPMHAIIALSSLLQETELTPEQRLMVETILKSSNLLATLINDVLDLSRLEDGSLQLQIGTFNLHAVFREVLNLIKPIASVKKLLVALNLAPDLPEYAVGDEKRLMQTLLNIVGNAVKFTKEGNISITGFVAKSESLRDSRAPEFFPVPSENHFYLRVQVKDSGSGVSPQDIPNLFTKFAQNQAIALRNSTGSGLGLAICKRFVNLMEGHIWIESEGLGKGCTAIFIVKLGIPEHSNDSNLSFIPKMPVHGQTNFPGLKVLVMDENGVSRSVEERKGQRKERMEKRSEEREHKIQRLTKAKENGQNIIIDLEFSHLMSRAEIQSLVQQIMYCYAVNRKCSSPAHLWLTGCKGDMESQLQRLPGFDKWIIEKENRSYIEALEDHKENLVYLTADSDTVLDDLDPNKIYIVGGLVDRNRWKGITMKKAQEQGIQTGRLPIGNYLKMSSSQVLTVNQVLEILLKFLETRDWKASFFQVIPQRKRCEADSGEPQGEEDEEECQEKDNESGRKKQCIEAASNS